MSSISLLMISRPNLSAIGTKTSIDSLAMACCLSGVKAPNVRKLCNLSASLIIMTRISLAIPMKILR